MSDLVVQSVGKSYRTPSEPLVVLKNVNLEMSRGDNLAIIGPSGSGKSTLLHIIGTLDSPTTGSVRLNDVNPFTLSEPELAKFRSQQIGFVFQDHHLLPQLSALENVLVPTLANRNVSSSLQERARELLNRVGLDARRHHRPAELSGGERQRVSIARALIHQPTLVLADEPTGNLDPTTAQTVTELMLELQQNSTPPTILLVVTHSVNVAQKLQSCHQLTNGELDTVPP